MLNASPMSQGSDLSSTIRKLDAAFQPIFASPLSPGDDPEQSRTRKPPTVPKLNLAFGMKNKTTEDAASLLSVPAGIVFQYCFIHVHCFRRECSCLATSLATSSIVTSALSQTIATSIATSIATNIATNIGSNRHPDCCR